VREEYCWLVADDWFVLREKYCGLEANRALDVAHRVLLEPAPKPCCPLVPEQRRDAGARSAAQHEALVVGQEEVARRRPAIPPVS
jgi:hypothetical protein